MLKRKTNQLVCSRPPAPPSCVYLVSSPVPCIFSTVFSPSSSLWHKGKGVDSHPSTTGCLCEALPSDLELESGVVLRACSSPCALYCTRSLLCRRVCVSSTERPHLCCCAASCMSQTRPLWFCSPMRARGYVTPSRR